MELRFLLGRAGSGKTRTCLQEIQDRLRERPDGPALIFLVPEQATFQMERALLTTGPVRASSRARVVSFRRLAVHVLQETGTALNPRLGALGKRMVLRLLLQNRAGQWKVFGENIRQTGFVTQLEETLQELRAWRIGPGDLAAAAQELLADGAEGELLRDKLHDLALLYQDFEHYLQGRFTDPDGLLDEVARLVPRSPGLVGATLWVDGFAGFTAQELHVLRALWRIASSTTIALCLDPRDIHRPPAETDLFAPTLTTFRRLLAAAQEDGLRVLPLQTLPEPPAGKASSGASPLPMPRFREAPVLAHLEARLFSRPLRPWREPAPQEPPGDQKLSGPSGRPLDKQLVLVAAADPATEVAAAARHILRLCREEGWRFRDISVILRDLENYQHLVTTIFTEMGIPFFIDRLRPLTHHPLVELVRSALEVHVRGWEPEPLFRCLRTDLFPGSRDEVDRLENQVYARGIQGASRFRAEMPSAMLDPLHNFSRRLDGAARVADVVDALRGLLEEVGAAETLARWAEEARRHHRPEEAREHEGVWEGVVQLLEEMEKALGSLALSPAACLPIVESGLEALTVGVIPPTLDQVLVGSPERSRQPDIKAAFILGAGEGSFPPPPQEDIILDDRERERLSSRLELGPSSRSRLLQEQYLTYITLTRSSHFLWVSYPTADGEGKALAPSPIFAHLRALFPQVSVRSEPLEPQDDDHLLERILVPDQLIAAVAQRLSQHQRGLPVDTRWWALYDRIARHPQWRVRALPIFSALAYRNDPGRLSPDQARALFGDPLFVSPSRLEDFAACPFRHFAAHGLRLRERVKPDLDRLEVGTFIHEVLRRFTEKLAARAQAWDSLSDQEILRLGDECVDEAWAETEKRVAAGAPRHPFALGQLRSQMRRTLLRLTQHARRSAFTPVKGELSFGGSGSDLPPLALPLPRGGVAHVRGQMDRVDAVRDGQGRYWVRVIDYKSRAHRLSLGKVVHGLSLQLPLYMAAMLAHGLPPLAGPALARGTGVAPGVREPWEAGAPVLPAGVLYFPVREDWERVDTPPKTAPAPSPEPPAPGEVGSSVPEELDAKMRGLLVDDVDVLQLMDKELAPGTMSPLIPAGLKRDGTLHGQSSAAPLDRWRSLLTFVQDHAGRLAQQMLDGHIDIAPYRLGQETPCSTCSFRSLCRFDGSVPGNAYRRLPSLSPAEAWNKVDQEGKESDAGRRNL